MNVIQIAQQVLGLLPATIDAVKAIEAAIPEGGKGKEKLALVQTTLQAAYTVGGAAVDQFASVWPALEAMISGIVSLFNKIGHFNNTPAVPPPTYPPS